MRRDISPWLLRVAPNDELVTARELSTRLHRAGTRAAMFSACNSGRWPFVAPFLGAGIPAVVGVQSAVSTLAAIECSKKLYDSLTVGLSLDEAVTYARLRLLDAETASAPTEWGQFMVYTASPGTIPFPRPDDRIVRQHQNRARAEREEVLAGPALERALSSQMARQVLLLGRLLTASAS